ncbi:MAG TPA: biotin/lipoyl-containing protein [Verrucomicrobiae bacterium]|jgi:biotin carboxyl carrier protein|nr:biotin/lipoyl-containing protein [Verrucomicrobiae bacterium]
MIKKLRVTVDGKPYEVMVEISDDAGVAAPTPPPPVSAPAAPPPPAPVAQTGAGPGEVRSPLAGRIIAINVKPGQEVKEGDHLLTVEAMKMNTSVTAPKSGTVAEILTTVGAAVDEGRVLARIGDAKQ